MCFNSFRRRTSLEKYRNVVVIFVTLSKFTFSLCSINVSVLLCEGLSFHSGANVLETQKLENRRSGNSGHNINTRDVPKYHLTHQKWIL